MSPPGLLLSANGTNNFYVDVVVYPTVNGTYTLQTPTVVAIGG